MAELLHFRGGFVIDGVDDSSGCFAETGTPERRHQEAQIWVINYVCWGEGCWLLGSKINQFLGFCGSISPGIASLSFDKAID